jgi:microcystin-dependent protein
MSKTVFSDGNPATGTLGTIVVADFLNMLNNQRHTGRDIDGEGALDYAVATGAANAYEIALTPALDAYVEGMPVIFKANHANTGPATLNVNGLGAKTIQFTSGSAMDAGTIVSGGIIMVVYDGTVMQLVAGGKPEGVPIGAEMWWPLETPPDGWFEEDGSSLLRATYPELFAKIGTKYGAADADHFNLPVAGGKFVRAWAHGSAYDPDRATRTKPSAPGATITPGDHVGTDQADAFKLHHHSIPIRTGTPSGGSYGMYNGVDNIPPTTVSQTGGNETRPINTYRMFIIKAY